MTIVHISFWLLLKYAHMPPGYQHCNGWPIWHHESLSWPSLCFDDECGNWMVKNKDNLVLLKSSTSLDNSIPDEVNTWEANVDRLNDKWIMSSDISIKAGTIKLQAVDQSTIQFLTIWGVLLTRGIILRIDFLHFSVSKKSPKVCNCNFVACCVVHSLYH